MQRRQTIPTVAEVLALPVLGRGNPTVLAGASALSSQVRWVHSAEADYIANLLRGGELVLTTGIALPNHANGLVSYVHALSRAGAVGLVVELGARWADSLPTALVSACAGASLPLISLAEEVSYVEVVQIVGEQIVDAQLAELRAVEQVHDRFTHLNVAGASQAEILAETTRISGCPVVLESFRHHVLGYDAGPAQTDDVLLGWEAQSRKVQTSRRTGYNQRAGWLVTVVGARGDDWGRLVLLSARTPARRDIVLVEQAAAALALHHVHSLERDGVERQAHGALLARLKAGDIDDDLITRCQAAGVPLAGRRLCGIALRPLISASSARATSEQGLRVVAAAAVAAVRSAGAAALIGVVGDNVQLVVSCRESMSLETLTRDLARDVHRRSRVLVGAGSSVDMPTSITRSLAEARHIVSAATAADECTLVLRLEDVHVRGLVHLLGDDDRLTAFADRELGTLIEHDRRHGTDLIASVRALLDHPGSKADAASAVHVSRPAFYDRIARAEQVLQVDLSDSEVRTSLHLALLTLGHAT